MGGVGAALMQPRHQHVTRPGRHREQRIAKECLLKVTSWVNFVSWQSADDARKAARSRLTVLGTRQGLAADYTNRGLQRYMPRWSGIADGGDRLGGPALARTPSSPKSAGWASPSAWCEWGATAPAPTRYRVRRSRYAAVPRLSPFQP